MSNKIWNPPPAEDYEGLLKQFRAIVSMVNINNQVISYYEKKDYGCSEMRLKQLEEALECERRANAILTDELEKLNSKS